MKQNHQIENDQRQRQLQMMQGDFEQQLETLKTLSNEEHARIYNEIRVFSRGFKRHNLHVCVCLIEQSINP